MAGKLTRAHRQLAARWAGTLAGSEPGAVESAGLDDAFTWLIDTMKVTEEERPAFGQAFAGTREWIARLPFGHSAALFHDLENEKKGSGELQMLAAPSVSRSLPKRSASWTFEKLDTLRHRIIQRAGRFTRPQGELTLTMSANEAVRKDSLHFLDALQKAA